MAKNVEISIDNRIGCGDQIKEFSQDHVGRVMGLFRQKMLASPLKSAAVACSYHPITR